MPHRKEGRGKGHVGKSPPPIGLPQTKRGKKNQFAVLEKKEKEIKRVPPDNVEKKGAGVSVGGEKKGGRNLMRKGRSARKREKKLNPRDRRIKSPTEVRGGKTRRKLKREGHPRSQAEGGERGGEKFHFPLSLREIRGGKPVLFDTTRKKKKRTFV